jgi:hypothetical protein
METVSLPVVTPPLKVKYRELHATPPYFPKCHFIGLICGSRGSGKTTRLVEFMQHYDKYKTFDKVILICPTTKADPKYELLKQMDTELEVHETYSDEGFVEILKTIRAGVALQESYEKKLKLYKKWLKDQNDLQGFHGKEFRMLEEMDYQKPKPPFRNGMPHTVLILDDLVGEKCYRSECRGPFANFCIRHRHFHTSVVFLTQTYHGTVPRQLRANLSFVCLFRNKNMQMSLQIAEEFSAYCSIEEFAAMWHQATEEQYGMFVADFELPEHDQVFVKGKKVKKQIAVKPLAKHDRAADALQESLKKPLTE